MRRVKPLGLLLDKDEKIVNHRSVLKIIFNPILRIFGIEIASKFDKIFYQFEGYVFRRCEHSFNIFKNYYSSLFTCNDYYKVYKKGEF